MTPIEKLIFISIRYKMPNHKLAKLMRVNPRTLRSWMRYERNPSPDAERLLKSFLSDFKDSTMLR